eukprot:9986860-Karenia_brevis.AAC.1
MLSAGGRMVGKVWAEILRFIHQRMDDDHFRMCLHMRLAMVSVPQGTTCQMERRGNPDDKCLHAISMPCKHLHKSKVGPARLRPHRAVMVSLMKLLRRVGLEVDLERALPYLYRQEPDGKVTEAILDVVTIIPGCLGAMPCDVRIRCPHDVDLAAHRPAVAAKEGEVDKACRYDATVTPLSLETYGRVGVASMDGLRRLASLVSAHMRGNGCF